MRLPPFAALRAFHAAATHDRFRDAAASLGLTESAISHQVRRLEEFLHASLFDRSGSRPKLTSAGRRYLEQVDPAIRHGRGAWPDVDATFILEETAMPVCAPGYLDPLPQKPSSEVLRSVRLIVNGHFPDEWEEWARAHGLEPPAAHDLIMLDAMEQVLQVAESGHGLAMGRQPVVGDRLARGRLVAPFGDADPTGAAYYLCRPSDATPTAAGRRLERWLTRSAAEWRGMNAEGGTSP